MKKVLVSCEESQAVTIQLREHGIEAYSCDIIDCSGGHDEWHIKQDVLSLLNGNCTFTTCDGVSHTIEGKWNAIFAFPPCFTAGTQVMTYDGMKPIESVQVGDMVLTHKGRYKKVLDTMCHPANQTVIVQTENAGRIRCTPNHRFYVSNVKREYDQDTHKRNRVPQEFTWLNPTEFVRDETDTYIKEQTYVVSVADTIEEIPEYDGTYIGVNGFDEQHVNNLKLDDDNLWYLLGRWLGDGWYKYRYSKGNKALSGIIICCGKDKTDELSNKIKLAGYNAQLQHERTTDRFEISNKELALFVNANFGSGALSKRVPGFVTRLPKELANAFLVGYFDSDGYINERNVCNYTSISPSIAYGIKYLVNKYWHTSCSISCVEQHTDIIEGRKVNVHDLYNGWFRKEKTKQAHYINLDNYILAPFRSIEYVDEPTLVYNLSVEDDESYTANGLVVHNCTHLSNSGARHFEKKRADGRQREAIEFFGKTITADCDKIVVENPMNIISGTYIKQYFPDLCEKYGFPLQATQRIQPWMFGDNFNKTTQLWIKGLPPLVPEITEAPEMEWVYWTDKKTGKQKRQNKWYYDALINSKTPEERSCIRSKTFPGVARAFAEQWSPLI